MESKIWINLFWTVFPKTYYCLHTAQWYNERIRAAPLGGHLVHPKIDLHDSQTPFQTCSKTHTCLRFCIHFCSRVFARFLVRTFAISGNSCLSYVFVSCHTQYALSQAKTFLQDFCVKISRVAFLWIKNLRGFLFIVYVVNKTTN